MSEPIFFKRSNHLRERFSNINEEFELLTLMVEESKIVTVNIDEEEAPKESFRSN